MHCKWLIARNDGSLKSAETQEESRPNPGDGKLVEDIKCTVDSVIEGVSGLTIVAKELAAI